MIIQRKVDLKKYTTLHIGGAARYFAEPSSIEDLVECIDFAKHEKIPYYVIGRGSNLLFDDHGFSGLIIKIGSGLSKIDVNDNVVNVESGVWAPCLARKMFHFGLTGLEHIVGIPGTVGGLTYMNGGSSRKYIGDSIVSVQAMLPTGDIIEMDKDECEFSYRKSVFHDSLAIILSVKLRLNKISDRDSIRKEMISILRSRRNKFPLKVPNCGSVFTSRPELFDTLGAPGAIIDSLGMKGMRVGGAVVSDKHANFILNINHASSKDFVRLINEVQKRIEDEYGVFIDTELIVMDEYGKRD